MMDEIAIPIPVEAEKTEEQVYLDAINDARSQPQDCGEYGIKPAVPPLRWNSSLQQAAKMHSDDMALNDRFDHTGSGTQSDLAAQALHPGTGSSFSERIEYAGYTDWSNIGENIAAGYVTVEETITAWLNSPPHCKNLMSPDFKEVGMAKAYNDGSHYLYYWTQDFGTRQ